MSIQFITVRREGHTIFTAQWVDGNLHMQQLTRGKGDFSDLWETSGLEQMEKDMDLIEDAIRESKTALTVENRNYEISYPPYMRTD